MTIIMYGIPNCDTIKKAKKWLQNREIEFQFHDYRKEGVDRELLKVAFKQLGWENVLNKRGATYRQLSEQQKNDLNESSALPLLLEHVAMIKRPILLLDQQYHLGFSDVLYTSIFNKG